MIAESIDREQPIPALTQRETAEFLKRFRNRKISRAGVAMAERKALRKLARVPGLKKLLEAASNQ